jgi:hypothetical protein
LAHIRQDNTRSFLVIGIRGEGLDVFDEVDCRPSINAALSADDAMREGTEVLSVFVEEDYDSLLASQV